MHVKNHKVFVRVKHALVRIHVMHLEKVKLCGTMVMLLLKDNTKSKDLTRVE